LGKKPRRRESLGKEESNMVRMFKRLLRGGGRQRVTGVWIL